MNQSVSIAFLVAYALLGLYALLALMGYLPVAPWSPVGEYITPIDNTQELIPKSPSDLNV